jgi:hypothetical protein
MMRTELFLGPKWEPTDRRVCFQVVSDGRRCACSMTDVIVGNSIRLASEVELGDALG